MVKRKVASGFDLLPAIDLRGGRVVRLEQGDFARETAFSDDPSAVAAGFAEAGARWLHVVDLDGARVGAPAQIDVVGAIVAAVGPFVRVEASGGLRSAADVGAALSVGASRIALGTVAVEDPAIVGDLVARHGAERIAVAVDVRGGLAVGRGWKEGAPGVDPGALLRDLAEAGVTTFEVTAIERDGLGGGPDLELLAGLVGLGLGSVIASGGIRSADDLERLAAIGCGGAIVGRALYDGSLAIEAAIRATSTAP
jgi:phosphoribosylformimino-5-aminoimidazole carboxamide ribotide isomerase